MKRILGLLLFFIAFNASAIDAKPAFVVPGTAQTKMANAEDMVVATGHDGWNGYSWTLK